MAKGVNAADAHRKQLRAKEKKKNKQDRVKARELGDVKKDTRSLENEVRDLSVKERNGNITSTEKADLDVARAEIARLKKIKEDYIKANPDTADAILPPSRPPPPQQSNSNRGQQQMVRIQLGFREKRQAEAQGLRFDRNGRLLNPQFSAYFDPVFNPFGVPPPGLAYKARPPTVEEIAARQAQQGVADDDIAMPDGPKPGDGEIDEDEESDDSDSEGSSESDDSDDSDDSDSIPLPPGPPPPSARQPPPSHPASINGAGRGRGRGRGSGGLVHAGPSRTLLPPQAGLPPRPPQSAVSSSGPAPASLAVRSSPQPPSIIAAPVEHTAEDLARMKASATISAAPQVRNLKKEALSFAPRVSKRKRGPAPTEQVERSKMPRSQSPDAAGPSAAPLRSFPMNLPPGFAIPPGMGGPSRPAHQYEQPSFDAEDRKGQQTRVEEDDYNDEHDEHGEQAGVSLPWTSGLHSGAGYPVLEGFDEEDDDDEVGVSLPPGPAATGGGSYPVLEGFDDEEGDEGDEQAPGVSMPPRYAAPGSYAPLEGYDDEVEDEQIVALPRADGGDAGYTPLEGFGDGSEQEEEEEDVPLPPGPRS